MAERRKVTDPAILAELNGSTVNPINNRPNLPNRDGSYSTELSITVTNPRLNGGKPTNIPSIWDGRRYDPATQEEDIITQALKSGQKFKDFGSIDEAVNAAKSRSNSLGSGVPTSGRKKVTDPGLLHLLNGNPEEQAARQLRKVPETPPAVLPSEPTADATSKPMGTLTATEPSMLERAGNALFDAGKAIGLPVDRMRRDAQGVDAAVRGAADVVTFGTADEIAAKAADLTGIGGQQGNYEGNLKLQRAVDRADEQMNPAARAAGQVAGAFLLPASRATSIPAAAAEGAAMGGAYGFGSGEGDFTTRRDSAITGAAIGGAAGAGVRGIANRLEKSAAAASIPTNAELRKAADAAYNKAERAGVIVRPEPVKRLASEIVADLTDFGFDPALQPGAAVIIKRMIDLDGQNITLKGLDTVRKIAGNVAKIRDNPSQQALAAKIIDRIDGFIDNLGDADVLTGNAKNGAAALKEARGLWSKLRKSEMVDVAADKAERRAASTGSGGNADNAVRQNVRGLLDNPKTARGMTAAEKKAAERVVRGTAPQNALRLAGKLAPTGVVSGVLSGGAGYGLAGPAGLALPLVGAGAKALADRMTTKNVERLSQIIRSGGKTSKDLATLARSGRLDIPAVNRIEKLAKSLGVPAATLAAVMREQAAQ